MARYCTNCYTPAADGEVFCKVCGQPLKTGCEQQSEPIENKNEGLLPIAAGAEAEKETDSEAVCQDDEKTVEAAEKAPVISLGEWVWSTLLCFIPIVGLVMLIIWAATSETNPNKQNFARAMLIWKAVEILIGVILLTMLIVVITAYSRMGYGYMY